LREAVRRAAVAVGAAHLRPLRALRRLRLLGDELVARPVDASHLDLGDRRPLRVAEVADLESVVRVRATPLPVLKSSDQRAEDGDLLDGLLGVVVAAPDVQLIRNGAGGVVAVGADLARHRHGLRYRTRVAAEDDLLRL